MKVLVMAGGTGGHVFPALAVAQLLLEHAHEVVWMGTPDGLEARVVPEHGIALHCVRVRGLRGSGLRRLIHAPWVLLRALIQAFGVLRAERPDVVLGMGGFASGPGGLASWLRRVPLVIHEQNAAPGLTNRLLRRLAQRSLQAFAGALPGAETVGNPVRVAFAALPAPDARFSEREGALRLLVVGGSQGARALNRMVPEALGQLPAEAYRVRHQGGRTVDEARAAYAAVGRSAQLEAFIEDMAEAYAEADLVICRAGAMTVAELAAAGVGAILVPFPAAVDDHQTRNAQQLVNCGAAQLVQESALDARSLAKCITALGDRSALLAMAQAARGAAVPDSGARIAETCLAVARS